MRPQITVAVLINAPVEKIWKYWTEPEHIVQWCFASDDWCAPRAENDLRVDGTFKTRMEAKDGSGGFDFEGTYTAVEENKKIEYVMIGADERKVSVRFEKQGDGYSVIETFDAEDENPLEMQKNGWQAILNNFKKYVEA
jgi:uncharacterized protein YndB with AHSA1/START domain